MDQPTFSDLEYQGKKRKTRRELFLGRMDGLIPWQLLEERIRPFYPKAGRGRHPYPLSVMLRTHCVQLFYKAMEEKTKASVRAKVEHPFLRLKRFFGYGKVRYRGLAKNMERLALLFGLGNLLTAEGQLAA